MAAAIALTPASGSITSKVTVVRVDVTGATQNDTSAYDTDLYPTSPELRYRLDFVAPAGTDDKRSYVFAVNEDGNHTFNSFVFDADGAWDVNLVDVSDDSVVATAAVTVS